MSVLEEKYDIAIVGAGHAGCEAALACARLGLETIMFTVSVDSIALMPCNPNIGGTSKGHLVREIDALGGEMGKNIDKTFIQSKMLNVSEKLPCRTFPSCSGRQAGIYKRDEENSGKYRASYNPPGGGYRNSGRRWKSKGREDLFRRRIPYKSCGTLYRYLLKGKVYLW